MITYALRAESGTTFRHNARNRMAENNFADYFSPNSESSLYMPSRISFMR